MTQPATIIAFVAAAWVGAVLICAALLLSGEIAVAIDQIKRGPPGPLRRMFRWGAIRHRFWLASFHIMKFGRTLRIAAILILARTFGKYEHSVWALDGFNYARYRWRGRTWAIPTTAIEEDEQ